MQKISILIVTGGYSGFSNRMPGTAGTLAAVLVLLLTQALLPPLSHYAPLLLLFLCLLVGTPALASLLKQNVLSSAKDPQEVVIDEFAGYYLAIALLPATPRTFLIGFLLFRIFDILKPPPIRSLERLPGAWGVMADDLAAGACALLLQYLLIGVLS